MTGCQDKTSESETKAAKRRSKPQQPFVISSGFAHDEILEVVVLLSCPAFAALGCLQSLHEGILVPLSPLSLLRHPLCFGSSARIKHTRGLCGFSQEIATRWFDLGADSIGWRFRNGWNNGSRRPLVNPINFAR